MDFSISEFGLHQSLDDLGFFGLEGQQQRQQQQECHAQSSSSSQHPTETAARPGSHAPEIAAKGPSASTAFAHPSSPSSLSRPLAASPAQLGTPSSKSISAGNVNSLAATSVTSLANGQINPDATSMTSNVSQDRLSGGNADLSGLPSQNSSILDQLASALQFGLSNHSADPSSSSSTNSSGNMSVQEIQRVLAEREQADRLQSLQTALLRQQLEALQRTCTNPQVMQQLAPQQQKDFQSSQPLLQSLLSSLQASQQQYQLQHECSSSLDTRMHLPPPPALQGPSLAADASQLLSSLLGTTNQSEALKSLPKLLSDNAVLAQYGLITPPASGGLNQQCAHLPHGGAAVASQPPFIPPLNIPQGNNASGPYHMSGMLANVEGLRSSWESVRHPFTPLESPAVTPASVFSNTSVGTAGGDQFFSPLTSPALRPQPSYYSGIGHANKPHRSKSGSTPFASPLALQGKSGTLPRKNRSTTAEARANRQRPSPLIKPTVGSVKRKKDVSQQSPRTSGTGQSSRRDSMSEGISGNGNGPRFESQSRNQSAAGGSNNVASQVSTFTPVLAGSARSMDASPSEGATSTPSPIDLSTAMRPLATGKPMTPGSLMGIGQSEGESLRSASRLHGDSKASSAGPSAAYSAKGGDGSASSRAYKITGKSGSVSFASDVKHGEDDDDDDDSSGKTPADSDSRRASHKVAEQKRRDSLKFCFDELRGMLPPITLDEDAPGGSYLGPDGLTEDEDAEDFDRADVMDPEFSKTANRAISKVALLRHSNEWIIRLRNRLARRDAALSATRREVERLRTLLMANGIMPPVTIHQHALQFQQHPHPHQQQPPTYIMGQPYPDSLHEDAHNHSHAQPQDGGKVSSGNMDWNHG